MRIIARFSNEDQIGGLVDSLRNVGLDRKDLIISDLEKEQPYRSFAEATEQGISIIKTESESLSTVQPFNRSFPEFRGKTGIIAAVEVSRHNTNRIREIMEQSGAVEIIQD